MSNRQIFDSLTKNAFDFLTKAVTDFDSSPKYSVIHFCAAVEMLLKAKLMCEHWSLVVSKPQEASRSKFEAGDFISVTLAETRTRLKEIAQVDLSETAYKSFDALAKHRNKMIHFYHAGVSGDAKQRELIASEQCLSWFHLHRLLRQWKDDFKDHETAISNAERVMQKHRSYLEAKFKELKPEIDKRISEGERVEDCDACGFKADVLKSLRGPIYDGRCLVCDCTATKVELTCPSCKKQALFTDPHGECPHCHAEMNPEKVRDALVDPAEVHRAYRDGDGAAHEINCDQCDGHHTVVRVEDHYLCSECFGVFSHVQQCEWCHELNTGDMSDSYTDGCNMCEGWAGHQKED